MSKETRPLFFSAWANYRYHWPRLSTPHHENIDEKPQEDELHPTADLKELINGHIMRFREAMKACEA